MVKDLQTLCDVKLEHKRVVKFLDADLGFPDHSTSDHFENKYDALMHIANRVAVLPVGFNTKCDIVAAATQGVFRKRSSWCVKNLRLFRLVRITSRPPGLREQPVRLKILGINRKHSNKCVT